MSKELEEGWCDCTCPVVTGCGCGVPHNIRIGSKRIVHYNGQHWSRRCLKLYKGIETVEW